MFLKNSSSFQVGLRTKKEIITLKPGDVCQVMDKDIISINSKLEKVSEEEFNKFIKATNKVVDANVEASVDLTNIVPDVVTEAAKEEIAVAANEETQAAPAIEPESKESTEITSKPVIETETVINKETQDEEYVVDKQKPIEVKVDLTKENPVQEVELKVEESEHCKKTKDEEIVDKIDTLKSEWEQETSIKNKDKITKQIAKLKDKLLKLRK